MPDEEFGPIRPEDLFHLRFTQEDAQFSPDGLWVAYTVSETDAESDEEHTTIWLLSRETGEVRRLTAGLAQDTDPTWSPDGRQIAFRSTRGGTPQIHLIAVDGGEARPLTALEQGVSSAPVWSPDGEHIAFAAGPAVDPLDLTKPYRITRHVYRVDGTGYLDNAAYDIYVIPAKGGEPKQLTSDDCQNSRPLWSPDGSELLFTLAGCPDSHRRHPRHPDLAVVGMDGSVRRLLGDWGYAWSAAWTPDGERVAFIGNPFGLPSGCQENVWVMDAEGGEPDCRTGGLTFRVGKSLQRDMPVKKTPPLILVSGDGQTAYVHVQVGGTNHLYQVALDGAEAWSPVVTGERSCILLDMAAGSLLFAVSTLSNPIDLFSADVDGSNEHQLTHLNADLLAQRRLPTVEHLSFRGTDGVPVEGWILQPAAGEAPYPTILYIHGGPHSGFGHIFSFDFQMLAGAGYAVLFVNHRGSTGYGDAFANQIIGAWGNHDYKDLMAGVDHAIERGLPDPERLGVCGLSGGGNLSCWIVGHTDRFKAAVPENPVTNFVSFYGVSDIGPGFAKEELGGAPHEIAEVYRRCSPITYAHRCKTPTLLIQGDADYRCPPEQSEQFYSVLKANGCIAEMLRLPESPHDGSIWGPPDLRRAQNEALLDWMNRHVLSTEVGEAT